MSESESTGERLGFGIYGFNFSRPITVANIELKPLYATTESRREASKCEAMVLTGHGILPFDRGTVNWVRRASVLADAMTFCQQQWVLTSSVISLSDPNNTPLPSSLPFPFERTTDGALILNDPSSQAELLEKVVTHIESDSDGPIARALYRQVELFRLSTPYWELRHFLAFTGLEILARNFPAQDFEQDAAPLISRFLRSHGFDVDQTLAQKFTSARNTAFHQGDPEGIDKNTKETVNAIHQLFGLKTLLADAILKQLNFANPDINWNRWHDRMPWGGGKPPESVTSVSMLLALLNADPSGRIIEKTSAGLFCREYNGEQFGRTLALIPLNSQVADLCAKVDQADLERNLETFNKLPITVGVPCRTYVLAGSPLARLRK